jgi:GAF domain-containing protein
MTLFKSPLIWRLTLWFLLLSLIPIGIVLVFVQRQVRDAAVDQQLLQISHQARLLAVQVMRQPEQAQEIMEQFRTENQTAFLLNDNKMYIAHSDLTKVGTSATDDLSSDILNNLLSQNPTAVDNSIQNQYIGATRVNSSDVAVVLSDSSVSTAKVNDLSRGVLWQLTVGLLITSLAGGTAIFVVLGPIIQLSKFADRLGSGELDAEFDATDLEGELATLAKSLNKLAVRIRASIATLEQRVSERTAELTERTAELESANKQVHARAAQLETLAQVSHTIASVRDLRELLPEIANAISINFGFYHVGVFLLDETNEYAVLSATNSEGGKKMLERKHRLRVGQEGIVGYVTSTGEARIAMDVGKDAVFFDNPELPDTHSEMALPLKAENRIMGALDVQSTDRAAFTNEDIQMLSLLADQVSLAIENARLFDETRNALAEAQAISRQFTREAWGRVPVEHKLLGYRYTISGAVPLNESVDLSELGKDKDRDVQNKSSQTVVPIELRGETIGTLVVQAPSTDKLNQDQINLIKAVAERVALSAENARLFEETTRRAERERLVSDITGKIRSVNDPQTMIQTAMEELRRALGASRVEVIPQAVKGAESS